VARRVPFVLVLPLLAGLGGPAAAQTLPQALAAAYWNNPEINAARAQTRAVDEGVPLAKSGLRPRVSGFGQVTGQWRYGTEAGGGTAAAAGGGSRRSGSQQVDAAYGINIEQDIFRGFRTRNEIREAEASVLASRHTLANTIQNVLFDAAQAYMDVLRDRAVLQLRQRNVEFLQEQLQAALDRFEVGEVTRTDVAQTRARLAEGQANVSLAEANLRASMATFRQVIGVEPGTLAPGFVFGNVLPNSLDAAQSLALAGHPSILAAIYNADAAAFEVKQIEGEFLPTVSIEGSAQRTIGLDSDTEANVATLTGRVTVPIYQGGARSARLRQAKELLGESRIAVDIRRAQVRAAVVAAWYQLEAASAAIAAATTAVEASQTALEGVQEELRVGQRTTLDVLDAQQELLDTRVTLVLAQRDRVVSSFALLSAIGYLDAERLNLPTARYDPQEHYLEVRDKWFGLRTPDGR
jgi:outer membrane protein